MRFFSFLLFLLFSGTTYAQLQLKPVAGLPSKEVYDLMIDHKGFLWVAHELGVSRYDGVRFKHYSSPQQASISMTDLLEDKQGRIWCHNFSSQVFYIENDKMHLLKAYDPARETQFPRMVLLNDELIATSEHGLFVCDTRTLQSKYISVKNFVPKSISSLSVVKDRVIATNAKTWFTYTKAKGLQMVPAEKSFYIKDNNHVLQPTSLKDTFYLIINPARIIKKLMFDGTGIKELQSQNAPSFINGVSIDNQQAWIHTQNVTISTGQQKEVLDNNISDQVTDLQGNKWFGSLKKGLLVQFRTPVWQKITLAEVGEADFARCISISDSTLVIGTQSGELILKNRITNKISWRVRLGECTGAIEYIKLLAAGKIILSTSSSPFVVDLRTRNVQHMQPSSMIKDVDVYGETIFCASPVGFFAVPNDLRKVDTIQWRKYMNQAFPALQGSEDVLGSLNFVYRQRSKAVRFDSASGKAIVAFKNGLYELDSKGMHPILYNNQPIYASSLELRNGTLFIGTMNNGLLLKKGGRIERISVSEGLASNSIIRIKAQNNHLWLFEGAAIQVLDMNEEKVLANIDLPSIGGSSAFDVVEVDHTAYLTSAEGLYKIPLKSSIQWNFTSYLNYVTANNKDTLSEQKNALPYYKNNIHFNLSIPWYNPTQTVYYKYHLKGSNYEESWQTSEGAEQDIRFASLMPGTYTFEAYAMVNGIAEKKGHMFQFVIHKPMWQQWWFISLTILAVAAGFYLAYRFRLQQVVKMEAMRRSISSDLHDDIGATLSSINIYTELARQEPQNKEYLQAIQDNARDIITKLDDLVWSINPKYDTFEQLINRMRLFAEPLLSAAGIQYSFHYSPDIIKTKLSINKKRNIYLIFKEAINNLIKHSGSKKCMVSLYCRGAYVFLEIKDEGRGFDLHNRTHGRNGIDNIHERARQIGAKVVIDTARDKGTYIQVATPVK